MEFKIGDRVKYINYKGITRDKICQIGWKGTVDHFNKTLQKFIVIFDNKKVLWLTENKIKLVDRISHPFTSIFK